jgi:hypothetical protein
MGEDDNDYLSVHIRLFLSVGCNLKNVSVVDGSLDLDALRLTLNSHNVSCSGAGSEYETLLLSLQAV